ncbi:MAG TPA: hypothetical protein VM925_12770 [Labilithrix sp.]|nr:hypothetical protein [Labilithrix sp.]
MAVSHSRWIALSFLSSLVWVGCSASNPPGASTVDSAPGGPSVDARRSSELASSDLELTWAVYPPVGHGENRKRNVELVARTGEAVRRLPLGAMRGALLPSNQSACGAKQTAYLKSADEVAKITFDVSGGSAFAVRQASPELLEVVSVTAPDEYCANDDCHTRQVLAMIPVPGGARIIEAIADLRSGGREGPFDCGSGASGEDRRR